MPGVPGWDFQRNQYSGGIDINNALANYNRHTSGNPAPNSSITTIEPFLDHGPGGTLLTNNRAFPGGGGDQFTVRANAFVHFTLPGAYVIQHGADDTTYTLADTLELTSPFIAQNACCGDNATPLLITEPGVFPFDFVFGEGAGGEWMDLGIAGPGIVGVVPLGDTANGSPEVFTMELQDIGSGGPEGPGGGGGAIPEPASIAIWSLLGLMLSGLGYYRVRRQR